MGRADSLVTRGVEAHAEHIARALSRPVPGLNQVRINKSWTDPRR